MSIVCCVPSLCVAREKARLRRPTRCAQISDDGVEVGARILLAGAGGVCCDVMIWRAAVRVLRERAPAVYVFVLVVVCM